ncbi:hypothetical protein BB560_006603, partial [Smittium megazygosporum]
FPDGLVDLMLVVLRYTLSPTWNLGGIILFLLDCLAAALTARLRFFASSDLVLISSLIRSFAV